MPQHRSLARNSVFLAAVGSLLAAHILGFRYVRVHARLSTAVMASLVVLIAFKHLGLLGRLLARFRQRSGN